MKTLLLLIVLLSCYVDANSQSLNGIPLDSLKVKYIQVGVMFEALTIQYLATFDYGQKNKNLKRKDDAIMNKHGRFQKWNSLIHPINFMAEYGYELLTLQINKYKGYDIYLYILKKKDE